jgi:Skp family chaperone for outer membrane proteins
MTSQIQDKLAKDIADEHQELKEVDEQLLKIEKKQQTEIAELNTKLDAILDQLKKQ